MSYSTDVVDGCRHAGTYVAKILGETKPADLPVLQLSTYELVVNLNAAKQLGVTVSPSLLALVNEVIE